MLPNIFKKKSLIAIAIFLGIASLIAIVSPSFIQNSKPKQASSAAIPSYSPPITQYTINSDLQSNSFSYADKSDLKRVLLTKDMLRETFSYLTCQVRGIEPVDPSVDCIKALAANDAGQQYLFKRGGVIPLASGAISALYTQPASGIDYTRNLTSNFGIHKAQAQQTGTGFNSIEQIQSIWLLFRNVVYLLLVIVFVVIGIAIMLRLNIDPRTVMTIQNQIPKAIVGIVLITFSYAIAGVLIDAMWVGTYFGINTIAAAAPDCEDSAKPLTSVATESLQDNPIAFTTDIFGDETGCFGKWDGINGLTATIASTFGDIFGRIALAIVGGDEEIGDCGTGINIPLLPDIGGGGSAANCIKMAFFFIIKYLVLILAYLVVLVAILVALFRTWFNLLKAFIYVLIDILLGPFWILLGLIPGSTLSFRGWAKNIFAQLAVFPVTALVLVIASIVARNDVANNPGSNVFVPPLVGNPNITDNLGALMAFGFILLTPELGNIVRDALKTPAAKATGGVSAMLGFATGRVTGAVKETSERIGGRNEAVTKADAYGNPKYVRKGFGKIPFTGIHLGGTKEA